MKIGVVTQYYKSCNYGGLLQAFAMVDVLKKMGHDAEQVCFDYYSRGSVPNPRLICTLNRLGFVNFFLTAVKRFVIYKIKTKIYKTDERIKERQACCTYFREQVIAHSQNVYDNNTIKNCTSYDALIVGSDQVWRCNVKTFHPGFWLDFAPNTKKLSYAASISMPEIPKELHSFIKNALDNFCAISVREKQDVNLLKKIVGDDCAIDWVLDPTLLVDSFSWQHLCEQNPYSKEKYVFTYLLGNKVADRKFVQKFAQTKGLKIINIPYLQNAYRSCDDRFGDIKISDVSPGLFLSLIRDAQYVITDSFHGTVFSNIFHKEYFVLKRSSDNDVMSMNSRVYSILEMLNLESRLVENTTDLKFLDTILKIDFDVVDAVINREKAISLNWLKNALEC